MNLYFNQADGPVITIHDLPQDVSLDYLKKHLRMKVPGACLKAGFFWINSKGKQLHILNSDQDLSEAKRTSKQGTIGLAVVVDSGMYAVFTIILQLLRANFSLNITSKEPNSHELLSSTSSLNVCSQFLSNAIRSLRKVEFQSETCKQ